MHRFDRTTMFAVLWMLSLCIARQVLSADDPKSNVRDATNWLDAAHTEYAADLHGAYDSIHISPDPNPVRVSYSRLDKATDNPSPVVFTVTNGRTERILFHDVQMQVHQATSATGKPVWKTVSEDYPNSGKDDIEPKGTTEFRLTPPPGSEPWRVAIVYSVEIITTFTTSSHRTFGTNYEAVTETFTNSVIQAAH
jgi:hypothetical protein